MNFTVISGHRRVTVWYRTVVIQNNVNAGRPLTFVVNQRNILIRPAHRLSFSSAIRPQTQRAYSGPVQAALRQRFARSGIRSGHQNRPCPGCRRCSKICINMAYSKFRTLKYASCKRPNNSFLPDQHRENLVGLHGPCANGHFITPGSVI